MTQQTDKPRYLTAHDIANELQLNKRTVDNWRYLSEPYGPPYIRIRGEIRYPADQFDAWCEEQDKTAIR